VDNGRSICPFIGPRAYVSEDNGGPGTKIIAIQVTSHYCVDSGGWLEVKVLFGSRDCLGVNGAIKDSFPLEKSR
jgi:hypothetical protein